MHLAAGEIPDEPRVNRAERELTRLGSGARTFHVLQDPLHLRGGEVSVDYETRLAADQAIQLPRSQAIADARGAAVLPDDGVADRVSCGAIPDDGGLALVGDSDGGDVSRADICLRECLRRHTRLSGPDVARVVLHPAWFGENLSELLLRDGDDGTGVIEDDRTGARSALVEREDVLHYFHTR